MARIATDPRRFPADDPQAARSEPRSQAGMPGSFRLVRLLGFDINIHWSWLLIALLVTWSLATGYLPRIYPEWEAGQRWVVGAITSVLFFSSVLAHELSHSVVARRQGVPVHGITLFIFGGVSALGGEARRARDEFWIAVVGPVTSFAIGGIAAVVWLATRRGGAESVAAVAGYLAFINVAVGLFNLLPGFPLDGGRVLRSALWGAKGNLLAATRIAANVGRVVAGLLVALGVLSLFGQGGFGGVWFIFIGWFLWNAAESSYQQLLVQNSLHGLTAKGLMEPPAVRVTSDCSLRQLANDYILRYHQRAFFVGPDDGEIQGLVTLSDLQRVPQEEWDTTSVFRAMTPRERLIVVAPTTDANEALNLMAEHNVNQLPIVTGNQVIGLLTRAALLRALQFRSQIPSQS